MSADRNGLAGARRGETLRPLRVLALAGASAFVAGCSDRLQLICTEIGCSSGVEVLLDRPPVTGFRVELSSPGSPTTYAYACPDAAHCSNPVFFSDFTPDVVDVRVILGADTSFAEAVRPQYTDVSPNGSRCPPTCHIGRVTATLPAMTAGARRRH
jgi:hypothetical protein